MRIWFKFLLLSAPRRGFTLLELLVSLVVLSILLGIAIPSYLAVVKERLPGCKAATCTGLDPKEQRCDRSVRTLAIADLEESLLELRYSVLCRSSWARAKAPAGSKIYVQDVEGNIYGQYTIPKSLQYTANYSDMGGGQLEACIRYPDGEVVCTTD
jgi:prepilin-type N-terminal cleavage/methylation domain-containing protein